MNNYFLFITCGWTGILSLTLAEPCCLTNSFHLFTEVYFSMYLLFQRLGGQLRHIFLKVTAEARENTHGIMIKATSCITSCGSLEMNSKMVKPKVKGHKFIHSSSGGKNLYTTLSRAWKHETGCHGLNMKWVLKFMNVQYYACTFFWKL